MRKDIQMKQAILITSYKDFEQLIKLINQFDETFNIYVHIDKKSDVTFWDFNSQADVDFVQELTKIKNVKYVGQDYSIKWGGMSHLKAYLRLSEIALKDKENSFFHLITGQDYPIKNNDYFTSIAKNTKCNYLEHFKMPRTNGNWNGGGMDRLEYYNFYDFFNALSKRGFVWINRFIRLQKRINFKRPINDYLGQLYGGSTYWSLSREVLQYVIDFRKSNKKHFRRFKYTFAAEEIYFPTVIMNSPYSNKVVNDNLRFIDWESGKGGYPAFLDETDFQDIINSNKLFARKIDKSETRLTQMITAHRNNNHDIGKLKGTPH